MKKILVYLSILLFASTLSAQNFVSGTLTTSTTWNSGSGPYIVTGDLTIPVGVTLTIDTVTEVLFDSATALIVNGELRSIGGASGKSQFGANYVGNPLAKPAGYWRGIKVDRGRLDLRNVAIRDAQVGLHLVNHIQPQELWACIIANNDTGIVHLLDTTMGNQNDSLGIYNCIIYDNQVGVAGDYFSLNYCDVFYNGTGVLMTDGYDRLIGCRIASNRLGVGIAPGGIDFQYITGSHLFYNDTALQLSLTSEQIEIYGNSIENNQVGLVLRDPNRPSLFSTFYFAFNVFCSNFQYHIFNTGPGDFEPDNNCFGSTVASRVEATFYDQADDPSLGDVLVSTFYTICDTSCIDTKPDLVFPGDCNHDQIANNLDLLSIGLKYFGSGTTRQFARLDWIGQTALDWGDTLSNGVDIKHVDCDGSGRIDSMDIPVIIQNYGLTHRSANKTAASGHAPLFFQMPSPPIYPGDTLRVGINLGSMDSMAQNIHGLAFSIAYDSGMVKPNSPYFEVGSSWLGSRGSDLLYLEKDLFEQERIDVAFTRYDLVHRSGHGMIAELIIVVDDNIYKREQPFRLDFLDVFAVDAEGKPIDLTFRPGEIGVLNTSIEGFSPSSFVTYPNPCKGLLHVHYPGQTWSRLRLFSLTGAEVMHWEGRKKDEMALDVRALPEGLYLLKGETLTERVSRKVRVVK